MRGRTDEAPGPSSPGRRPPRRAGGGAVDAGRRPAGRARQRAAARARQAGAHPRPGGAVEARIGDAAATGRGRHDGARIRCAARPARGLRDRAADRDRLSLLRRRRANRDRRPVHPPRRPTHRQMRALPAGRGWRGRRASRLRAPLPLRQGAARRRLPIAAEPLEEPLDDGEADIVGAVGRCGSRGTWLGRRWRLPLGRAAAPSAGREGGGGAGSVSEEGRGDGW